jgi:parallel beta-helix repeat protein
VIDGDGTQAAGCDPETEFCDLGVLNEGHDGITVRNGSVRQFAIGVFIVEARRNHVLDVSSSRNTLFGALLGGASRSVIRNSSLSRNIAPEGDGLGLFGSDHNRILHNSIRRNPGPGIHVGGSGNNLIKGNRFVRNAPSVVMEEADGNRVRRNHVVRGAGILVAPGNRNVIARNRVSGALDSIAIEKGRGNVVARNAVVDSRGAGIRLALVRPPIGGEHTIVRRNRVRRSGEDGFLVNAKDRHSVLKRNVAIGSDDDGFDVESHSATLAGNRAIRNDDLGIEADDGVTDGGGNTARDNGDPRECTNIRCG